LDDLGCKALAEHSYTNPLAAATLKLNLSRRHFQANLNREFNNK